MRKINPYLTPGMHRILTKMRQGEQSPTDEHDGSLTWERGGGWWCGIERTSGPLVKKLLWLCLIKDATWGNRDDFQNFVINEDGRGVLDDVNYVPTIIKALKEKEHERSD